MPFCSKCGKKLSEADKFCSRCGAPASGRSQGTGLQPVQRTEQSRAEIAESKPIAIPIKNFKIPKYDGQERRFTLFEREVCFSAEQDCYLYYRNNIKKIAIELYHTVGDLWNQSCRTFDDYVNKYILLYSYRLNPVYQCLVDLLIEYEIYDIVPEDIGKRTDESGRLATSVRWKWATECVDKIVDQNCAAVEYKYSTKPTLIFDGLVGYALASAYTSALNKNAVRDYNIASNLYPNQKKQLYDQISKTITEDVYKDVMGIGEVFMEILAEHGKNIAVPTADALSRANSIVRNMEQQNIGPEKVGDLLKQIFESTLDLSNIVNWIVENCPKSDETKKILTYLKQNGI